MHFVIMGSGRVGAAMAIELDRQGHSVAVVDQNPAAFRKLKKDFSGQKVKGVGFDRDTLQRAGIEDAYAFAAVSNGDNSNILSARVARETFGVKRVVARIYDPRRAELYQRLGIATVGPVKWTSRAMLRRKLPDNSVMIFADQTNGMEILRARPAKMWLTRPLAELEKALGVRVAYVSRLGNALLARPDYVVQENDELFIAVQHSNLTDVSHQLANGQSEEK
ncbi:MAG: TrkA family potassium uptake protein [Winkia neuii]|uniref:potassium channel family protein n=1 Tax=Winkia neuii TaxID=33007 RepID=UPI00290B93AA|nr:TrkA family potassium uptake protein [Winkia neuii]MDU5162369.1 TrkA family potassium uptake protein [Winkia neuii]